MSDLVNKKNTDVLLFSRALKIALKSKGLKQNALADILGVKPTSVSSYLLGKREPGIGFMTKIAAALGYDLVDFLSLGRSLVEGDKPPINPEVAGYLDKARSVLEGPDGDHLKAVIEAMSKARSS